MQTKKLQIIPLGGLGEFGMNCLAVRWEDDIIVIDAGLMFPESELLGVDIVVPDITYLIENKKHVRAIVLTHGHEDHIGGLPWILNELKVPVYATEFTLAYVEDKLEEHRLLDETELIEIAIRCNLNEVARPPGIVTLARTRLRRDSRGSPAPHGHARLPTLRGTCSPSSGSPCPCRAPGGAACG